MMPKLLAYVFAGILSISWITSVYAEEAKKGIYTDIGVRFGANILYYNVNLGKEILAVEPRDPWPTKLSADIDGYWGGTLFLGPEVSFGTNKLRFRAGIEGRACAGITEVNKLKVPNPPPYESYVFTEFKRDYFSYMPYLGVILQSDDLSKLGVIVGLPYSVFDVRTGNDWWGSKWTYQKDSWRGAGWAMYIELTGKYEYDIYSSILIGYESYRPVFLGEKSKIDAYVFGFSVRF